MPATRPLSSIWSLTVTLIAGALACAALFFHIYILRPEAPDPWATAPDLEPVPAVGERLMIIVVDAMNPDRAFDPEDMPFVASQLERAAWGYARPQIPTLTGSAVSTLGTGRWTTLVDAIYNFTSPEARSDSLFRRLDEGGARAALFGDSAWSQRFGRWADDVATYPDHGVADTHASDTKALAAVERWLDEGAPHRVALLHLVGADHVGHQHGTTGDGPYARRLRELDASIARVVARLPPDTSVLVISDHGMTPGGGHGGGADGTRDAPFIWWGPGVVPRGDVALEQAAIAPTVAGYMGVTPPAEAAAPPATELLAMTPEDAARLHRNATRQWIAASGRPDGSPLPRHGPSQGLAWALLLLIGPTLALAAWPLLSGRARLAPASWWLMAPLALLAGASALPALAAGGVAVSAMLIAAGLTRRRAAAPRSIGEDAAPRSIGEDATAAPTSPRRARAGAWLALGVGAAATALPILRWWSWHVPLYGALTLALLALSVTLVPAARRPLSLLGVALAAALLWVLFKIDASAFYTPSLADGSWGHLPIALCAALALWPWRRRAATPTPTAPAPAPSLLLRHLTPIATCALTLCAILQHEAPQGALAKATLAAAPLLVACVAWQRPRAVHLIGAVLLASAQLFTDAQLTVLLLVSGVALALASLPAPARLDARLALAPLAVTLLEAATYLALGKEYSFSSVQVALAFTGDADLALGRAVLFIALGDVLPWTLLVICAAAWAQRSAHPRYRDAALAALACALLTRLWCTIIAFVWIERSFWLSSSSLPFLAATLTLIVALPLALALARRVDPALNHHPDLASRPVRGRA